MEVAGKVIQIKADAMRLMSFGGSFHEARELRDALDQGRLALVLEQAQIGFSQRPLPQIEVRKGFPNVTQNRTRPRMGVLNIEHRVIPRLLGDLGEVEI